jgi:ATP-binding protein involved in chromosome partitioning
LRQACEQAVRSLPGVLSATAVMTSERPAPSAAASPASTSHAHRQGAAHGGPAAKTTGGGGRIEVPGVKHIIAVASGKGGVGKSTTAVNLALGLAANGVATGLLDADIYGPSMPRMLDVKDKPESIDGKALKPIERYGLKTMSIGYIVNEDTPMIWRGPMVSSALEQMLRDVQWGDLDVLVVDMPPGTGDAQLTLAQRVALAGAVIVSTPQDIALVDARKGLNMFRKVAVPVLGFVENMSFFVCPHCGERSEIFGHGGAREEADKLGVPFLGEVPLHLDIRTTSDSGHPIVVAQPDSQHAQIYKNIAGRVWKQLSANQRGPRAAPRIVVR